MTGPRRPAPACPICRRRIGDPAAAAEHRSSAHGAARTLWWAIRQPGFYRWLTRRRTRTARKGDRHGRH